MTKFVRNVLLPVLFASLLIGFAGGCSTEKYAAEKVNYTMIPSKMSKSKKISRNYSQPVAKQTTPLAKKYIIKNTRKTEPVW
jgi:hypothetical protein